MPRSAFSRSPIERALRVLEGRCDAEVARHWIWRKRGTYTTLEARSQLAAEILRDAVHGYMEKETTPGIGAHSQFVIYYDDAASPSDLAIYDAESGREITDHQAREYVRELLMERVEDAPSSEEIAEIKGDARYHEMKDAGVSI